MAHKFDPRNWARLDNPERRKIMPPEETLKGLGLRPGDVFVDIGCGIGYFTVPALRIVGPGGKVLGLDTSERMLEVLRSRVSEEELHRLVLIKSDEYTFHVEPRSATFALAANVLHEVDDREAFIERIGEILVDAGGGKLAVIEWEKRESEHGPPLEHRLERRSVEKLLRQKGFRVIERRSIGHDFYAIVSLNDGPWVEG
jgi:ubiquinone/menaquinone biosynthesis C-methylase UbiE